MKSLFDWKRVEREVRVVTPEFQVWKNGKLASIVIYIKIGAHTLVGPCVQIYTPHHPMDSQ